MSTSEEFTSNDSNPKYFGVHYVNEKYFVEHHMTIPTLCSKESLNDDTSVCQNDPTLFYARQAHERIKEFNRLKRARYLIDAIFLTNELVSDGSDVEVLSLASTIINRFKSLGVFNTPLENFNDNAKASMLKPPHTGIYHCCTFCSSGGKKEASCSCGGTMPGGYRGCGHGHVGHPGVNHWSCCGSVLRHGRCLALQKDIHQLLF